MFIFPEPISAQGVITMEHNLPNTAPDFKGKVAESPECWMDSPSLVKPHPSFYCTLKHFLRPIASDIIRVERES